MAKFRCKLCNYSSNKEGKELPRVCPNCGESRGLDYEKSANDLLMDED